MFASRSAGVTEGEEGGGGGEREREEGRVAENLDC